MAFGKDLQAPEGFSTDEYLLRPIVADDAELDYEAVMETKELLRQWEQSSWPEDDFTVGDNREDMVKMEQRHKEGYAFGYIVMNLDETQCLGCVYIFAHDARDFAKSEISSVDGSSWSDSDALVYFWVRKSRMADQLDLRLLTRIDRWFAEDWGFQNHLVVTSEAFEQQVSLSERTGKQLKFRLRNPSSSGVGLAYA